MEAIIEIPPIFRVSSRLATRYATCNYVSLNTLNIPAKRSAIPRELFKTIPRSSSTENFVALLPRIKKGQIDHFSMYTQNKNVKYSASVQKVQMTFYRTVYQYIDHVSRI